MQPFIILSVMVRDNMNLCQCTGPASQIPILITAPHVKKTNLHEQISYSDKALMNFHHDVPNSHVPDINFLGFLVHALSVASHHHS